MIRRQCRFLVTIGACATAGGIQALKNWANVEEFMRAVYATPDYINTLATSTPIADHVMVDFELRGCPINKHQLVELIAALLSAAGPGCRVTASASNASDGGRCASRWPRGSPAWGRSRRPAAGRSARASTANASAATARRSSRTWSVSAASTATTGPHRATWCNCSATSTATPPSSARRAMRSSAGICPLARPVDRPVSRAEPK